MVYPAKAGYGETQRRFVSLRRKRPPIGLIPTVLFLLLQGLHHDRDARLQDEPG